MKTLTATFSTLSRDLNPHAKGNRWPKITATKEAKEEARILGEQAWKSLPVSASGGASCRFAIFNKAKVSITLYADTKLARARRCYVPSDVQNLIAAVKPHIDGLKDAGWVADDSSHYITGFDPVTILKGKDAGGRCALVITFTEVE